MPDSRAVETLTTTGSTVGEQAIPNDVIDAIMVALGTPIALGCALEYERGSTILAQLWAQGLITLQVLGNLLARTGFGLLGLAFAAGLVAGFAVAGLLADASADQRRGDPIKGDRREALGRGRDRHARRATKGQLEIASDGPFSSQLLYRPLAQRPLSPFSLPVTWVLA